MGLEVLEVAEITDVDKGGKETVKNRKCVMKHLSVLGAKLLNQVLQGSKLSPVDKIELLQEKKQKDKNIIMWLS